MSLKTTILAAAIAALPAMASAHMVIEDAYARVSSNMAMSGAAFMSIFNHSDIDDRLVSASSDIAQRVELHTHIQDTGGVMRMVEIEDGIELPAGETVLLERGGLHVMFMGLNETLEHGDEVEVTFTFETADPVTMMIPVDLERMPEHGGHGHGHGDHSGHQTN
ncbi:MAG: copper chaperone PCu(A)C [Rhodobacteraceae bacterium]|nr:copper chaperone PCu(A)C [Paracoccaceae bacterium]